MASYVRPPVPHKIYLHDDGRPFEYGDRWDDGPPEDAYSVDSHPERFAPLHDVADALVEHLATTCVVDVARVDPDDVDRVDGVRRVAALRPRRDDAAPLTFAWTDRPGVEVRAGALVRASFPSCGCDACDDSAVQLADDLESTVFGVVAGGLREWVRSAGLRSCWVGHSIAGPSGELESAETRRRRTEEEVRAGRARLKAVPHGRWQPWEAADAASDRTTRH